MGDGGVRGGVLGGLVGWLFMERGLWGKGVAYFRALTVCCFDDGGVVCWTEGLGWCLVSGLCLGRWG